MSTFTMVGDWRQSPALERLAEGLRNEMIRNGYAYRPEEEPDLRLALHFVDPEDPRHFRRKGKGTFVVTVAERTEPVDSILKAGYPILVRSLGNMMIYLDRSGPSPRVHFITLEQGCYPIPGDWDEPGYFRRVFERLLPLATAELIIDNTFEPDLPEPLWEGDELTRQINRAGKKLDEMNLLPAPFPIEELLSERELRHVKRLYGIGGLSYGNLSTRKDENRFWMSASGVNKAKLETVGRDILMIKGYSPAEKAMRIS